MAKTKSITIESDKQAAVRFMSVTPSIGKCEDCPLENVCEHSNDEDTSCRLVDAAVSDFMLVVSNASHLKEADAIAIRNVASMFGAVIYYERFIQEHGMIETGRKGAFTSSLGKDYLSLLTSLNNNLTALGMTPRGRANMKTTLSGKEARVEEDTTIPNSLEAYASTNKVKKKTK